MRKHITYYKLKEALTRQGCPICRLAEDAVNKFFEALFYEYVNDPHVHKEIIHSGGFCKTHIHHLFNFADNLGASIIFSRLARVYEKALQTGTLPDGKCPACKRFEEASSRYCKALADFMLDKEMREAYKSSDGLCMKHLRDVLLMSKGENKEWLSLIEQDKLRKLAEQMEQFIEAADYRFEDDERRRKYSRVWEDVALKLTPSSAQSSHKLNKKFLTKTSILLGILAFLMLLLKILFHPHG